MRTQLRVAAIGDSHFDTRSRWEECLRLHDWIADDLAERAARGVGPDLIVHTGDVYERAPTAEEQNAVERWLTRLAAIAPVVLVRGNHDPKGALAIMGRLETKYPILVEEACAVHVVAGMAVGCVAWPEEAELLASLPEGVGREEAAQLATQALRNVYSGLGDVMAEHDGPRLLVAHAMVCGSKTSHGQPLVAKPMETGIEDLALSGADFVALGHVHKGQAWQHGNMHVVYTGSPRRTAYGEIEDKGYLFASFDRYEDDREPFWTVGGWERVIAPATPMLLLTGVYAEQEGAWDIRPDASSDWGEPAAGAEIRLRYSVPADRRVAAKARARELKEEWLAAGAVDVKDEDEVIPVVRARAPEIAKALTVADQLAVFWQARQIAIAEGRRARLEAKLADVIGPEAQGPVARATLRFNGIRRSAGWGAAGPVDIDFDAVPGPLVALVGPNGVGKTTTLEQLYGAVYRKMITRGTLATLAQDPDAWLEVRATGGDGTAYRIRHQGGKVVVTNLGTGRQVLDDALVSHFDAWIARTQAPPSVVANSMFAAQKSQGLIGIHEKGERYAVLLRALGVERLEDHAEECRKRARGAKERALVAAGRLADEKARGVPVKTAKLRLAAAEDNVARAKSAVAEAEAALQASKLAAEVCREASRQLAEAQEKRGAASTALDAAKGRLADLETRVRNNAAVLAEAETIRAGVARLEELRAGEAAAATARAEATTIVDVAKADRQRAHEDALGARQREQSIARRVQQAQAALAGKAEAEHAAASLERLRGELIDAEATVERAAAEVQRIQGIALVGAEERIARMRGSMTAILSLSDGPISFQAQACGLAEGALSSDDAALRSAQETPPRLRAAREAAEQANARLRAARTALASADQKAARLEQIRTTETVLTEALKEHADARRAIDAADLRAKATDEGLTAAERALATITGQVVALTTERGQLAPVAKRFEPLMAAEGRLTELRPQLADAQATVATLEAALTAITLPPVTPLDSEAVARAMAAHEAASAAAQAARTAHARQADEVRTAEASEARQAGLDAERGAHEEELADWTLLADSLGRNGVQALIVDAVGPTLTTLVNELLHTCHGPRFTMRIDTAPFTADGKRQVDRCEIMVLDTTLGKERAAETFSGGELAFLSEALSLALTVLVCQRSGLESPTLIRDEPGAHLTETNQLAYMAMLRRAAVETRAHRIIFVSHHPEVIALADGRIDLGRPSTNDNAAIESTVTAPQAQKRRAKSASKAEAA